ncbi:MAG: 50S ribosomal protein L6, partial [Gemmataceae bacterium]
MSRIGKQPVSIPAGVKVKVADGKVFVEGPKGKLEMAYHRAMKVEIGKLTREGEKTTFSPDASGQIIQVSRKTEEREARALHGLTRSLVANMVE